MRLKPLGLLVLGSVLAACPSKVENTFVSDSEIWASRPAPVRVEALTAMAVLSSPEGIEGQIDFEENEAGTVMRMKLTGLTPERNYSIKIHRIGDCSADFSIMGPPFLDPNQAAEKEELAKTEDGSEEVVDPVHVGIITEILALEDGTGSKELSIDPLMLSAGSLSIRHRSVVLHGKSTLRSRRREDSSPVACGVIDPARP